MYKCPVLYKCPPSEMPPTRMDNHTQLDPGCAVQHCEFLLNSKWPDFVPKKVNAHRACVGLRVRYWYLKTRPFTKDRIALWPVSMSTLRRSQRAALSGQEVCFCPGRSYMEDAGCQLPKEALYWPMSCAIVAGSMNPIMCGRRTYCARCNLSKMLRSMARLLSPWLQ